MTAVTYHVPGAVLTEREHEVPLDHAARTARRSRSSAASLPRRMGSIAPI
jgi:hypothetical protein